MSENNIKPPTWFWIVSAVALIWNLMGVANFIMQVSMTPEVIAALPEAERTLYETIPTWAYISFAVAVFSGSLGCLLLLLRKQLATAFLVTSLAGIIVQMIHSVLLTNSFEVYGPVGMILPIMLIIIGALLIWLSISAIKKGWVG